MIWGQAGRGLRGTVRRTLAGPQAAAVLAHPSCPCWPARPPRPRPARRYDGTVRNAMGEVMQFLYGEDGMEGTAIEGQRMDFLRYNRRRFRDAYRLDLDSPAWAPDWLDPEALDVLRNDGEARALLEGELQVGRGWRRVWCGVVWCGVVWPGADGWMDGWMDGWVGGRNGWGCGGLGQKAVRMACQRQVAGTGSQPGTALCLWCPNPNPTPALLRRSNWRRTSG